MERNETDMTKVTEMLKRVDLNYFELRIDEECRDYKAKPLASNTELVG